MKRKLLLATLLGLSVQASRAATEILTDNFNAPETANFDGSSQAGRRGGLLADAVVLRSSMIQHGISNNMLQLLLIEPEGRVRFHDTADSSVWHDFAGGASGEIIRKEGGLRIEFDWIPVTTDNGNNWVELSVGSANFEQIGQEPPLRMSEEHTDIAFSFGENGKCTYYDNGVPAEAASFTASAGSRHVVVEYAFTSNGDGAPVTVNASVDGTAILTNHVFTWDNNEGKLYIEFGSNSDGTLIDNFSIHTLKEPVDTDADGLDDDWEMAKAGNLTDLNGQAPGPGPGAGTGDFDGDGLTDLQEYTLSRSLYGNLSPLLKDSDGDGLTDYEEVNPTEPRKATNPGAKDTDGDGLSDLVETNTGVFNGPSDTGSDPTLADTDGDGYNDKAEVVGEGNPVNAFVIPNKAPSAITFGEVTDPASTGISPDVVFTHKVSGGAAAYINGVELDALTPDSNPPNFKWDSTNGKYMMNPGYNYDWVPALGEIFDLSLLDFFGTMTHAYGSAGDYQTYTLSGLEPGQTYELRLFIRKWADFTTRASMLKFANGAEATEYLLLEDKPGVVLGNGNNNSAYYLSFTYTTTGTDLVLTATIPNLSTGDGAFHLYGLTNRMAELTRPLAISSLTRDVAGDSVSLTFSSNTGRKYAVDYSEDLNSWIELTDSLDATGVNTTFVDKVASKLPKAFYRVRDVTPP